MSTPARTIGPLHFEDLEPRRFEDLVRQLVHDFRRWRRLEATGRAGSDDGFDVRGHEMADPVRTTPTDPDTSEESDEIERDRLWLVQCKRERKIPPKKLVDYLDDIRLAPGETLYGLLFVAACDFSKLARDRFAIRCTELGIREWHLWGKAEIEDLLFRPENDSLLFAYFGISLVIRRRTQRSELRARLAMKRKAHRTLDDQTHRYLLLRTADDPYPYADEVAGFHDDPPWRLRQFAGFTYEGLAFRVGRHFAWLDPAGVHWDAALAVNTVAPSAFQDPWHAGTENPLEPLARAAWEALPAAERAWLEVTATIPYENVLDIDELGDEIVDAPHVYAPFLPRRGPFTVVRAKLRRMNSSAESGIEEPPFEHRVARFPEPTRHDPSVHD